MKTGEFVKYLKKFLSEYPKPTRTQLKNFIEEYSWTLVGIFTKMQRQHLFEELAYRMDELGKLTNFVKPDSDDSHDAFVAHLDVKEVMLPLRIETYKRVIAELKKINQKTKADCELIKRLTLLIRNIEAVGK